MTERDETDHGSIGGAASGALGGSAREDAVLGDLAVAGDAAAGGDPGSFAARLNRLFATVHPPGRRPHTNADVAHGLTAAGHRISKPYISQLRSGHRTNPSEETVSALARFFKVKPDYFYDPVYQDAVDRDLEVLNQLRNNGVRRLSARAFDLSEESQILLTSMAEKLRASEGLPEIPPDSTP